MVCVEGIRLGKLYFESPPHPPSLRFNMHFVSIASDSYLPPHPSPLEDARSHSSNGYGMRNMTPPCPCAAKLCRKIVTTVEPSTWFKSAAGTTSSPAVTGVGEKFEVDAKEGVVSAAAWMDAPRSSSFDQPLPQSVGDGLELDVLSESDDSSTIEQRHQHLEQQQQHGRDTAAAVVVISSDTSSGISSTGMVQAGEEDTKKDETVEVRNNNRFLLSGQEEAKPSPTSNVRSAEESLSIGSSALHVLSGSSSLSSSFNSSPPSALVMLSLSDRDNGVKDNSTSNGIIADDNHTGVVDNDNGVLASGGCVADNDRGVGDNGNGADTSNRVEDQVNGVVAKSGSASHDNTIATTTTNETDVETLHLPSYASAVVGESGNNAVTTINRVEDVVGQAVAEKARNQLTPTEDLHLPSYASTRPPHEPCHDNNRGGGGNLGGTPLVPGLEDSETSTAAAMTSPRAYNEMPAAAVTESVVGGNLEANCGGASQGSDAGNGVTGALPGAGSSLRSLMRVWQGSGRAALWVSGKLVGPSRPASSRRMVVRHVFGFGFGGLGCCY